MRIYIGEVLKILLGMLIANTCSKSSVPDTVLNSLLLLWSLISFSFYIPCMNENIVFVFDLFHLAWYPSGPSILIQMTKFHSFLWLRNIPLYICIYTPFWVFLATLCGLWILVPWLGIELGPPHVKVPSPNHWTASRFPYIYLSSLSTYLLIDA